MQRGRDHGRGGGQGVEVTGRVRSQGGGGGHREGWRSWEGVEVMERRQEVTGRGRGHRRGRGHGVEVTGVGRGHGEGSEVMVGEEGRERGQKLEREADGDQALLRPG